MELLANHEVESVAWHEELPRHGNSGEAHLQRHSRAEATRSGRSVAFHPKMELLLGDLRREIPCFPANRLEFPVAREVAGLTEDFRPKMLPDYRAKAIINCLAVCW